MKKIKHPPRIKAKKDTKNATASDPKEFEETRSLNIRMKPQPYTKTSKNKGKKNKI